MLEAQLNQFNEAVALGRNTINSKPPPPKVTSRVQLSAAITILEKLKTTQTLTELDKAVINAHLFVYYIHRDEVVSSELFGLLGNSLSFIDQALLFSFLELTNYPTGNYNPPLSIPDYYNIMVTFSHFVGTTSTERRILLTMLCRNPLMPEWLKSHAAELFTKWGIRPRPLLICTAEHEILGLVRLAFDSLIARSLPKLPPFDIHQLTTNINTTVLNKTPAAQPMATEIINFIVDTSLIYYSQLSALSSAIEKAPTEFNKQFNSLLSFLDKLKTESVDMSKPLYYRWTKMTLGFWFSEMIRILLIKRCGIENALGFLATPAEQQSYKEFFDKFMEIYTHFEKAHIELCLQAGVAASCFAGEHKWLLLPKPAAAPAPTIPDSSSQRTSSPTHSLYARGGSGGAASSAATGATAVEESDAEYIPAPSKRP